MGTGSEGNPLFLQLECCSSGANSPLGNDVFHMDFLPGPERGGHSLGMVPLFSLLAFSLVVISELAGLSQCYACPHTLLALPALGHEGKFQTSQEDRVIRPEEGILGGTKCVSSQGKL